MIALEIELLNEQRSKHQCNQHPVGGMRKKKPPMQVKMMKQKTEIEPRNESNVLDAYL